MTTIAAGRLSDTLQSLVDARLDTIDRMLLGRVNRYDRLAIVREVETQIFDLLEGRDQGAIDRQVLLMILARLDPPEAYLPDPDEGESVPTRVAQRPLPAQTVPSRSNRISTITGTLGLTSAASAILPIVILMVALFFGGGLQPEAWLLSIYYFFVGTAFLLGIIAMILAPCVRFKGGFTVVGYVAGLFGFIATIVCMILN